MFAHLHLHTEYSLLDGACRIDRLMEQLKEQGMTACAITDHGVMYGVVDFYRAAKSAGIHPVIGCEVYVCPDMDDKVSAAREYSHLVLLCENQEGYRNLTKLVSEGFTRGFYYRPRVDYRLLRQHSKGLIALSACLSGDIPKLLLDGRVNDAGRICDEYISIFGKENFYIELQDHGLPEQKQVLPRLVALAREKDLQMVASNDCHYLRESDASAQEILMCIQTGKTLSDENRMRMNTDQLYVKSEEEMRALFPAFPDAIENTQKIAERCHVEFDFNSRHLPAFPLPDGETDAEAYLRKVCEAGLLRKYGPDRPDARERMEYELSVISSMGFPDYFLIVWDFIRFARENGILVGPGRGSAAGSIVAYVLDITEIEPLEYSLVFERFLNPERISMPDIDTDFDYENRGKVIEYVERRYGSDHVAQIITFGTMAARGVIRDVGRVMDMSYQQTDAIAKLVPFELGMTLERALSVNPELRRAYDGDEAVKRLIDTARTLEGMPRHASTHAAGVLITAKPVSDYLPLQQNGDVITTQFPMGTIEALGLLKMDFLGLRTLNVIGDAIALAGLSISPEEIPLDDAGVYKMISDGETDGVFQLESQGMRQFLTGMKPENFEDIIAAISLYRPGPMDSIPRYIEGKLHPETVTYLTPELKPILNVTYGCMVYQEQVMQIVRDLAGYSMGRSDLVRRAMAKKKHDVMAKEKDVFINGQVENGEVIVPGCVRNGISKEAAERLFDEMTAFASYAFNKSHAAAYAVVACQTAWLKLHYPVEFMAAMMNSLNGNTDKVAFYIQYCRKRGIAVRPPDVNLSEGKFSVDGEGKDRGIRFGLAGVKSLGHNAIDEIVSERTKNGPFTDLYDFIERTTGGALNKKGVESLIRAGAMDNLPGNRAQKLHVFEKAMDGASKRSKGAVDGQISLFDFAPEVKSAPPPMPRLDEFSLQDKLRMEKETTGVYVSGHPLDDYADALSSLSVNAEFLASLQEEPDHGMSHDQKQVRMGGMIAGRKLKATKNGSMMAFVDLEDLYGTTEVLVFPKVYERLSQMLVPDTAVLMSGKLSVREEESPKLLLDKVIPLDEMDAGAVEDESLPLPPPAYGAQEEYSAPRSYDAPRKRDNGVGKLYLRLTSDVRDEVLTVLSETPGRIPVYLYMEDEKKTYLAPREYWVDEGYDFGHLAHIIGPDSVVFKR